MGLAKEPCHVFSVETSHARRAAKYFSAEYRGWRSTRGRSLRPSRGAPAICRMDKHNRLSIGRLSNRETIA